MHEEKSRNVSEKRQKERNHSEYLNVYGRILLKWISGIA
jgi:hypothetical protein